MNVLEKALAETIQKVDKDKLKERCENCMAKYCEKCKVYYYLNRNCK
jgi:hypothetical protein